ncbi:MAG: hypothetical protein GY923_15330 [Aestuariibacter sp.]|nr:hypothetical protein [Aestuariibacter sp.]
MKRLEEYTRKELMDLNDGEVQNIVELETAFEGLRPYPCPANLDNKKKPLTIQKAESRWEYAGLLFKTEEDARSVASMRPEVKEHSWDLGTDIEWPKLCDKDVLPVALYGSQNVEEIRLELLERKRLREAYAEKKLKYDQYTSAMNKISGRVWADVYLAREFKDEVNFAHKRYEKFLELSDGNEDIAKKFLHDAYNDGPGSRDEEILQALEV